MRLKKNTILLPAREVTRDYIEEIKARYKLSWESMDQRMRYAPRSRQTYHAYRYPEGRVRTRKDGVTVTIRWLNARFKARFSRMVETLMKEHGQVYHVTLGEGIKRVPSEWRITHKFQTCRGHRVPCTWVDKDGYCGDECRTLVKAKEAHPRKCAPRTASSRT